MKIITVKIFCKEQDVTALCEEIEKRQFGFDVIEHLVTSPTPEEIKVIKRFHDEIDLALYLDDEYPEFVSSYP